MKLLVLNGVNLNLLGIREPDIYGKCTFADLEAKVSSHATAIGIEVELYQSNFEGALVERIQQAYFEKIDGIVFNPGAYTHTSIALLDVLKAVQIPCVEVHISDISKRESFRQTSYIRAACCASIIGHGIDGYVEAMDLLKEKLI
ncbi:MAG: 3-dehydroquinate dehydratase [Bacteroidales bacterium]|nr:3-dehydroquinate dehydratase [Bacteroidales bacterium]